MNIGIIGCGGVAKGHVRVYQDMKDARIVAVSDIDLSRARVFAERYGISKFFSDYLKLLEMKDLDFVDICTPTSTHVLVSCDAAKFGHNVLVEKPMARSTAECNEMIHESNRMGVKLCVCHNQIFFPSIKRAKFMVDSGRYDLVSFRTSVKESPETIGAPRWNLTPEEKGILWEAGCHPVYLQLHFLKDVTEVYACGSKAKYPVYDSFVAFLRTPKKSYGVIEVSWLAKEQEIVYEVGSSDGKRALIDRVNDSLVEKSGEPSEGGLYSMMKMIVQRFAPSRKTLKTELRYFIGHYYLIHEFMKSLKNDATPPVPPEEGKRTIRLLECIEKSVNNHQPIKVDHTRTT